MASGKVAMKTFGRSGTYGVILTVTDAFGWPTTASRSLTIANVPPSVAAFTGADLIAGETYAAAGSFTDPGTEVWTATADYGDGRGPEPLALTEKAFTLTHPYRAAGTYTVTVTVADDAGGQGSRAATVSVVTPAAATQSLIDRVTQLGAAGDFPRQLVTPLVAKLAAAMKQMERGNNTAALGPLGAFVNQVDAAVRSGRLATDVGVSLRGAAERIQAVL